ncbi:hypothetical protein BMS3Abin07_01042 [bacterium BMS3Abin07]|nr:hypothetical protein BMS3Abin07_01042 [bacterium BMS3Abin07]
MEGSQTTLGGTWIITNITVMIASFMDCFQVFSAPRNFKEWCTKGFSGKAGLFSFARFVLQPEKEGKRLKIGSLVFYS